MRLLLDTHALLWWLHEPDALSQRALAAISDPANEIWASAVSAMEIATKSRRGRLEYQTSLADDFSNQIAVEGFLPLSVSCEHAQQAGLMQAPNVDPWDRLLAAQARLENLVLVSKDSKMDEFGIAQFW
jgi:PIN domain nuclease of toxin-antitoxin system